MKWVPSLLSLLITFLPPSVQATLLKHLPKLNKSYIEALDLTTQQVPDDPTQNDVEIIMDKYVYPFYEQFLQLFTVLQPSEANILIADILYEFKNLLPDFGINPDLVIIPGLNVNTFDFQQFEDPLAVTVDDVFKHSVDEGAKEIAIFLSAYIPHIAHIYGYEEQTDFNDRLLIVFFFSYLVRMRLFLHSYTDEYLPSCEVEDFFWYFYHKVNEADGDDSHSLDTAQNVVYELIKDDEFIMNALAEWLVQLPLEVIGTFASSLIAYILGQNRRGKPNILRRVNRQVGIHHAIILCSSGNGGTNFDDLYRCVQNELGTITFYEFSEKLKQMVSEHSLIESEGRYSHSRPHYGY